MAGSYTGILTITLPELQTSITCPASTAVTQSGATVNVAPLVLTGECGGMSIPLGAVTVSLTGFFGRELRLSLTMTSSVCWNIDFTATLSR